MAAEIRLGTFLGALDLVNGTEGITLADGGWVRNIATRGQDGRWPRSIPEVLTLRINGEGNDDTLAGIIQEIDERVREAGDFAVEPSNRDGVFLEVKLDSESTRYRAFVRSATTSLRSSFHTPPASTQSFVREYVLAVERAPFWEPKSPILSPFFGFVNLAGGRLDLTGFVGDVPGRIGRVRIRTTSSRISTEFWMGFRTGIIATPASFQSIWECEDAGSLGANTSISSDSAASGSSKLVCALPAGASLASRFEGTLNEFVGSFIDSQVGEFQVLLRAKATGTRDYQVRLRSGFRGADIWRTHGRASITSTEWLLYSLGSVRIPPASLHGFSTPNIRYYGLALDAGELVAGTGDLDLDALILIPKSEGFCYIKDGHTTSGQSTYIETTVDDEFQAWGDSSSSGMAEIQQEKFFMPPFGAFSLFIAGQNNTRHSLNEEVFFEINTFPRWLVLRGAE